MCEQKSLYLRSSFLQVHPDYKQGYNARKVISEVYASFVLQCSPCHGIYLLHKKSMKYSGHRKLLCGLSKLSKLNAFIFLGYETNTDASFLVYKFRPERTDFKFNKYAEYTLLQLTFLTL